MENGKTLQLPSTSLLTQDSGFDTQASTRTHCVHAQDILCVCIYVYVQTLKSQLGTYSTKVFGPGTVHCSAAGVI